jgi:hypothetical protein
MDALLTVAGFLAGDQAYRTLANLNQCSKLVSAETLTILYEKVVWEDDTAHWIVDKGRVPDAWSYTRYARGITDVAVMMTIRRLPQVSSS